MAVHLPRGLRDVVLLLPNLSRIIHDGGTRLPSRRARGRSEGVDEGILRTLECRRGRRGPAAFPQSADLSREFRSFVTPCQRQAGMGTALETNGLVYSARAAGRGPGRAVCRAPPAVHRRGSSITFACPQAGSSSLTLCVLLTKSLPTPKS